jgi:hypothetical protein
MHARGWTIEHVCRALDIFVEARACQAALFREFCGFSHRLTIGNALAAAALVPPVTLESFLSRAETLAPPSMRIDDSRPVMDHL